MTTSRRRVRTTGRSNWILHRKWEYSICCMRDVILKIERDVSNSIFDTLISGVKFSWTTLHSGQPDQDEDQEDHVEERRRRFKRTRKKLGEKKVLRDRMIAKMCREKRAGRQFKSL